MAVATAMSRVDKNSCPHAADSLVVGTDNNITSKCRSVLEGDKYSVKNKTEQGGCVWGKGAGVVDCNFQQGHQGKGGGRHPFI